MVDAVVFVVVVVVDAGWCLSWYVVRFLVFLCFECSVVFRCVVVCVVGCRDVYFSVRSPLFFAVRSTVVCVPCSVLCADRSNVLVCVVICRDALCASSCVVPRFCLGCVSFLCLMNLFFFILIIISMWVAWGRVEGRSTCRTKIVIS